MTRHGINSDSSHIKIHKIIENLIHAYTHELREPIRSVSNMAQILYCKTHEQLDNKDSHYLQLIRKNINRMDILTKDLSSYLSIIEQKNFVITSINTNNMVNYLKEKFRNKIKEHSITFTTEHLPAIVGVRSHIYRLFYNIIENAVKFRADIPLNINILAYERDEHLEFHICDNGIGIDKEYHTVIFDMFYRLHNNNDNNNRNGSGIGLALCKEIIDQHHGTIFVESKPGTGSTFVFTLPKNKNPMDKLKKIQEPIHNKLSSLDVCKEQIKNNKDIRI